MIDLGLLIARLMMSLVFLLSGLDKALHWSAGLAEIESAGLPAPAILLAATVMTQLGGGLSLAIGLWARAGAFLLAGFTVLATVLFHDFWNAAGPTWQQQFTTFMEHVALVGGFLAMMVTGPGTFSIDRQLPLGLPDRRSGVMRS
jgi:putative oxidoreductase